MTRLLSFLAFLSFAATSSAQIAIGPKLSAASFEVDFGEIKKGEKHVTTYVIKNTGNQPLLIKDAKGSCDCTVPKYPQSPIRPGGTAELEISYDAKSAGPFNKTVTLTTNEQEGKDSFGSVIYKKHEIEVKGIVVD